MPFHHFLSKTYIRQWGYTKNDVWVYDKLKNAATSIDLSGNSNQESFGKDNYYRLKAGSLFMPPKIADRLFSCLNEYLIVYKGEKITTSQDLNLAFPYFNDWMIYTHDNQIVDASKKNELNEKLRDGYDDIIEKKWGKKYENLWPIIVKRILQYLILSKTKKNIQLNENDIDYIFRCLIMYDWRCQSKYSSISQAFDFVKNYTKPLTEISILKNVRYNDYDNTLYDEVKHAQYLEHFYNFLNGFGKMYGQLNLYNQLFTLVFIISESVKFLTCESPVIEINSGYGIMLLFIVHPNLIVSLALKDSKKKFVTKFIDSEEAVLLNKAIYRTGNQIIGFEEDFSSYI